MKHKIEDRRVKKTKKALEDALIKLLLKKDINNITVKEITDLADVNRGTFYFHYHDIYDLMNKKENSIIEEVECFFKELSQNKKEENLYSLLEKITDLFLQAPQGIPLFTKETNLASVKRIREIIRDNYLVNWLQEYTGNNKKEDLVFYSDFLISGYLTLTIQWMKNESQISKKEFIVKLEKVILKGMSFLE